MKKDQLDKLVSSQLIESKYIIQPEYLFKLIFDLTGFCLIIGQAVIVPLSISFNFSSTNIQNFNYLCDIFFILDIVLYFNTGFYQEGILITNRKSICFNYIKGWLAFDIVSSFPYAFILDNMESSITVILSLTLLLDNCKKRPKFIKGG
jgi:hypothetical protein